MDAESYFAPAPAGSHFVAMLPGDGYWELLRQEREEQEEAICCRAAMPLMMPDSSAKTTTSSCQERRRSPAEATASAIGCRLPTRGARERDPTGASRPTNPLLGAGPATVAPAGGGGEKGEGGRWRLELRLPGRPTGATRPVRDHFNSSNEAKVLLNTIKKYRVTN